MKQNVSYPGKIPKVYRLALNRIIGLLSAKMGKEKKNISKQKQKMDEDGMSRGKEYGVSGTLSKELVAEDLGVFKNALKMDSEKFNELIPLPTQLFSRKHLVCRTTLVYVSIMVDSCSAFHRLNCFVPFTSVNIFKAFLLLCNVSAASNSTFL